jgi:hypothetical protein
MVVGKYRQTTPLGKQRLIWEDNIKILKCTGCQDIERIHLPIGSNGDLFFDLNYVLSVTITTTGSPRKAVFVASL